MPKVIIHIAYDAALLDQRNHLLKEAGHEVISVLGNSDALRLKHQFEHADAVLVGAAAPAEVRRRIVRWIRECYPSLPVIALVEGDQVPEAQMNVDAADVQGWLAAVAG